MIVGGMPPKDGDTVTPFRDTRYSYSSGKNQVDCNKLRRKPSGPWPLGLWD